MASYQTQLFNVVAKEGTFNVRRISLVMKQSLKIAIFLEEVLILHIHNLWLDITSKT
jgi:hypothetical protein